MIRLSLTDSLTVTWQVRPVSCSIFLEEHFDQYYNTTSNMVEYRGKANRDFNPLNESNIYRMMHLNDIKVYLQQISILLNSGFVPRYHPITNYFNSIGSLWDSATHGDYLTYLSEFIAIERKKDFISHLKNG